MGAGRGQLRHAWRVRRLRWALRLGVEPSCTMRHLPAAWTRICAAAVLRSRVWSSASMGCRTPRGRREDGFVAARRVAAKPFVCPARGGGVGESTEGWPSRPVPWRIILMGELSPTCATRRSPPPLSTRASHLLLSRTTIGLAQIYLADWMATRFWQLDEHLSILVTVDLNFSTSATAFPAFVTYCDTEEALNLDPWTLPDASMAVMPMGPEQARAAKALQQSAHAEAVNGKDIRGYAKWISSGSLAAGASPLMIKECGVHTGSRVWEGALVQLQWVFQHLDIFKDRSVLELGAGCGLLGLAIAKAASPREMVISEFQGHFVMEGTPSLLDLLLENVQANISSVDAGALSVWDLDWTKPKDATCRWPSQDGTPTPITEKKFDMIIGSELIYSTGGAAQLLGVLSALLAEEGACYLLNNIRRSGVPELMRGCADVQLACEQIPFEKPPADSIVYTMGDHELSNSFVLLKITRSLHRPAPPARIPSFTESDFSVKAEYHAWVTQFDH